VTELGTDYAPWDEDRARTLADSLKELPGACLPILHALQEEFGYVHADAIPIVALALNLSKAEIVGVVNFYADFRQEPPARHIMKVCLADSCRAMGSQALVARLETDRSVSLEAVYCLGNCALSPAVMLDGRLLGRMYPERAATLVAGRSA
jgi:formate dehydrogenase subunit gamma